VLFLSNPARDVRFSPVVPLFYSLTAVLVNPALPNLVAFPVRLQAWVATPVLAFTPYIVRLGRWIFAVPFVAVTPSWVAVLAREVDDHGEMAHCNCMLRAFGIMVVKGERVRGKKTEGLRTPDYIVSMRQSSSSQSCFVTVTYIDPNTTHRSQHVR
jgi:hypothetical protein